MIGTKQATLNTGFRYDCDLIGGSLMVRECRTIASLLLQQPSADEWKQAIQVDNILQKRSLATSKRNATAIRARLERLQPDFWQSLRDGNEEVATQIAFLAALERNLLLIEFIETTVRDAVLAKTRVLNAFDWDDFLTERQHRDPVIEGWKESSRKKMGQVAIRMLIQVGLLDNTKNRKIQRLIVQPEVNRLLEKHNLDRLKACLEVSQL